MGNFAYIAIWDGKCQAIAAESIPDIKKVKRQWINDGADEILKLPQEEAKERFLRDF